jgi:hypothetical protein
MRPLSSLGELALRAAGLGLAMVDTTAVVSAGQTAPYGYVAVLYQTHVAADVGVVRAR